MCGIAGFINFARNQDAAALAAVAKSMSDVLTYRGPDEGDTWTAPSAGFALGQRRLSIVDLSPAGHQPMPSADGRFVIAYNGEIYNAREVAADLPVRSWRGHSDTEVLIEACAAWGVEKATKRFIGMFAFALWDNAERKLTLVRDRLGIKPLYFGRQNNVFLFASELKAFRAHPAFTPSVSPAAIAAYLRLGYVPSPLSIFEGISKLPPGHILSIDADGREHLTCYWDVRDKAVAGQAALDLRPDEEIIDEVADLLADAVRRRMVADVPVGAFLSGGIDSATVVALMQTQSSRPVKTFTIGFDDKRFNEAARAKAIAKHLGTEHSEMIVSAEEARAVIPLLPDMFDEPFADYSQIPTYLVSKMARRDVTVSLSGDGGDEVFGGYTRYFALDRIWRTMGMIPSGLRARAGSAVRAVPPGVLDIASALIPEKLRPSFPGDKMHKAADIISQPSPDAMYANLVSLWQHTPRSADTCAYPWNDPSLARDIPDLVARMRMMDMVTYLPGDILDKLDRATMAVSLEGRIPLLDHRLVEKSWTLPRNMLIRDGKGKWLLRQILRRHVPDSLTEQPKMGFSIPLGEWLRGPLREWAEDLISEDALASTGFIDASAVRQVWSNHLTGQVNRPHNIWAILMLQAWARRWI
jgi:asparagine synthase (glutamine-hydrolysing)